MSIHIGKLIKEYCYEHRISIHKLATGMNFTPQGVYRMLRSSDMKISYIRKYSEQLGHNFFLDLASQPQSATSVTEYPALLRELEQLRQRNFMLEQENSYLKQINELLKVGKS
ncbi:MAG: hypothetical protein M0R21_03730 [Lentimicrobiaceae bacterium]|nr:hypothetical protein [Lentimicrobiaceae bacterium]